MADLQTDVRYIKGIGEARAKALSKLGIATLQDLIGYFPRRYEDRTMTRSIRELELGETVCVRSETSPVSLQESFSASPASCLPD